jgi:hypothetical protein
MIRKLASRLTPLVGMLLMLGGCGDGPTLSDRPEGAGDAPNLTSGAGAESDEYQTSACCETVVVTVPGGAPPPPPKCDPWTSLNWCEGDGDCMTGTLINPHDPEVMAPSAGSTGCYYGGGGSVPPPPTGPVPCPEYECPPPDGTCDPRYMAKCEKPLTPADSAALRTAIQRHLKPASQFTDPPKAQQCAQLMGEFDRLFAAGKVFRGASDTREGHPLSPAHVALYSQSSGTMHFEPSALNAANAGDPLAVRNLLNSALHEAAHSLGYGHTEPVWSGDYDLYTEAPFDLLSPGTNSCIVR